MNNRLRQVRNEKNMTLVEEAQLLKDSSGIELISDTLAKYERGVREPKLATWEALSELLGVSVEYLQGRSEYRTKQEEIDSFSYRDEEGHLVIKTTFVPYAEIEQGVKQIVEGTQKAKKLHDSLNDDYQTYSSEFIKLLNSVIELNDVTSFTPKHFEVLNDFISKLSTENLTNKQIEEATQKLKVELIKIEK